MPHVAVYITGHGFGHATRTAAVVAAFIGNADLLAGNWRDGLERLLGRDRSWPALPANGAELAADLLRDRLG